jgi:PAS domain S-box-containing protein
MNRPVLVLHLEDSPRDAELVRDRLHQAGMACELQVASDRAEYEAALARTCFDLILSDYGLPDYDGMAALALARVKQPEVPFILISGTLGEEQAVDCVLRGATDYVLKQRPDRLVPAVLRALAEAEEQRLRRQAEEALRSSEERYRHLFESMEQGVVYQAADGRIVSANPAAERILGLTLDQMMGRVSTDPRWRCRRENGSDFPGEEHPAMLALRSGRPVVGTMMGVFHPVENQYRWILVDAVPEFRPGDATPFRVYATFSDITQLKRADEALRESEERYAALFRGAAEGILVADLEARRFTFANPAICQMLGYSEEEMKRLGVQDIHPAESLEHVLTEFHAQARGEKLLSPGLPCRRKDGSVIYADVNASSMTIDGRFCNVGFFTDVTERKRAEEKIVHLNRILRAVRDVNQLIVRERDRQRLIEDTCRLLVEGRGYRSAMIVLADAAGVPRAWAESGLGDAFQPLAESLRRGVMPPCCPLAQQHEGVYHVTDRAAVCSLCPIGAKLASSDPSCIQLRHGGTTYGYLAVSVDRMLGTDAEEDSLLCEVAGDVAFALHGMERAEAMTLVEEDRDRAENELRQSQKMEAVGRLAGGVAHDFNNILTVINASCSFLEEGLHASEPLLEDIRTISEASQSAARLTRQLLAFSRRQVLEPRPLDLNVLVGESEKMLNRLIGEDIRIRVEPAPALGFALADPGQLEQVIVNLAVNARDAMPDGGTLTITTANVELDEVFVSLHAGSSAGPFVRLVVSDTGVGMDAETLARVFEPFFTTKGVGKGTGLGLSTVYGIVKQSGGFIAVDSAPGRGSTFGIYLPRVEPAGQPWQPPSEAGSSRGRGETILLVEDNNQLRAAATRTLKKMGYRVFAASGLDEARRIAATEGPIHLLLTDVVMPGGSGRDVSTAVAAAHPAAKVLYMSGFTDEAIVHRGVLDPGTAFLHKPFTQDSLGRKVREVLDG